MNLVFSHREAATSNLNTAIHDSCFFLFFLKKILFNEPTQKEKFYSGWMVMRGRTRTSNGWL
ncbi:Uncharacterized protein APZ42_011703 [Daphnia magna]|uniref:Uncharacterized protein n=1 Tax=Daphnia magna TaxID=35525 RepID=A0A162CZN0_9CRUS|nr:Uncharacterized protein APZ42_011703 [Daphnia magna]